MATLRTEFVTSLPVTPEEALSHLPSVLEAQGFEVENSQIWKRAKERCRASFICLPDQCPTLLEVRIAVENPSGRIGGVAQITLSYTAKMPGQIMANTDTKALELEAMRIFAGLAGRSLPDTRAERRGLMGWTVLANTFLALVPGFALLLAMWGLGEDLTKLDVEPLLRIVGISLVVWAITLWVTAKTVVAVLNRCLKLRGEYRLTKK